MKKIVSVILALTMLMGIASVASAEEGKSAKVGVLQYVEHAALDAAGEGFLAALADNGYTEGENLEVTYMNASGDNATLQLEAGQLGDAGLDVILGIATPAVQALSAVIDTTPVLGTAVTDYVAAELVASNDAPGANVSGTTDMNPIKEQVELLLKLVPECKTIGVLYTSSEVNSETQAKILEEEATAAGLTVSVKTISAVGEVQQAVESMVGQVDALYLPTDNIIASSMSIVVEVANQAKLPTICGESNMVVNGGLATYGLNYYKLGYQTGLMAVRILEEGATPATMPIESLATEDMDTYLNQTTADEIGMTLPEDLVAGAAEVYTTPAQ